MKREYNGNKNYYNLFLDSVNLVLWEKGAKVNFNPQGCYELILVSKDNNGLSVTSLKDEGGGA